MDKQLKFEISLNRQDHSQLQQLPVKYSHVPAEISGPGIFTSRNPLGAQLDGRKCCSFSLSECSSSPCSVASPSSPRFWQSSRAHPIQSNFSCPTSTSLAGSPLSILLGRLTLVLQTWDRSRYAAPCPCILPNIVPLERPRFVEMATRLHLWFRPAALTQSTGFPLWLQAYNF